MLLIFLLIIFFLVTVSKGVSANLMQAGSKRRRTKAQIEEDKEQEVLRQAQM